MTDLLKKRFVNFLENMAVRNLSPNTITHRKIHGDEFLEWCTDRDIISPTQLDRKLVEAFQRYVYRKRRKDGQPYSVRSQLLRLDAVRSFCRYMTKTDVILYDPTDRMDLPKRPDSLPKAILSHDEIERVMTMPDVKTPTGIRDRTILETLWATGIRREELVDLDLYAIDFEQQTLMVRQGKGNRDRVVPIGVKALNWVRDYMDEVRPILTIDPDEQTLFLSTKGKPIKKSTLSCYVGKYIRKADLGKTGSCHLIRHSVGTLLMQNGLNMRYIQQLLGHRKLETTQIYTHLTIMDLKKAYLKAHPSAQVDDSTKDSE